MVLGNFVILFLCFLADVAVGWLGSSVVLWWVVFVWCFSVVEVLAGYCILCYLLSSKRDDSFQKTRASLPSFCHANCVRTVSICMCWLFFICRNENINGVGTTGLDFLCLI